MPVTVAYTQLNSDNDSPYHVHEPDLKLNAGARLFSGCCCRTAPSVFCDTPRSVTRLPVADGADALEVWRGRLAAGTADQSVVS